VSISQQWSPTAGIVAPILYISLPLSLFFTSWAMICDRRRKEMGYDIDWKKISIDDYKEILRTADLLMNYQVRQKLVSVKYCASPKKPTFAG
jgi:hypothetical protein